MKFFFPFSILYGFVTDIRNYFYDKGFWQETIFHKTIINVGNLTVGGTGKTPHVEYLIRLLKFTHSITTLSRGYGRNTTGFIVADSEATAQSIGDEPFQLYRKFGQEVVVTVGEKRVEALTKIFNQNTDLEVIILDDAFQHRAVKPSLNILLMDYSRPIYEDFCFPAGRLRERRHGSVRADVVIISKCPPDISPEKQKDINYALRTYLKQTTPVFFSKILYGKPKNCRSNEREISLKKILLISGIANPKPFEEYARKRFEVINHIIFNDHHNFTEKDFVDINLAKIPILMTEKDMVKFQPFLTHELLKDVALYYLPIEIDFLNTEMKLAFDNLILSHVSVNT